MSEEQKKNASNPAKPRYSYQQLSDFLGKEIRKRKGLKLQFQNVKREISKARKAVWGTSYWSSEHFYARSDRDALIADKLRLRQDLRTCNERVRRLITEIENYRGPDAPKIN